MNNSKEFIEIAKELSPVLIITSLLVTFLKGGRTVMEYIKAPIASLILGIPSACLAEFYIVGPNAWLFKYAVVLITGSWSICLFNGMFKIFKRFEEDPVKCVADIKDEVKK